MWGKPKGLISRSRSAEPEPQSSQPAKKAVNQKAVRAAEAKIANARKTYEQTRQPEHWAYVQQCIDELEQLLKGE